METKEIIQRNSAIDRICNNILSMDYGEIIYHEQLSNELDIEYNTPEYRRAVTMICKICFGKGKLLQNINKVGYKVVVPDGYSSAAVRKYKTGAKYMDKGEKILKNAPVTDMSVEGKQTYQSVLDRAIILNAHMQGALIELKHLDKAKKTLKQANELIKE